MRAPRDGEGVGGGEGGNIANGARGEARGFLGDGVVRGDKRCLEEDEEGGGLGEDVGAVRVAGEAGEKEGGYAEEVRVARVHRRLEGWEEVGVQGGVQQVRLEGLVVC